MGYEPPSYAKLYEETGKLEEIFNGFSSRYIVGSYTEVCFKVDSLKEEYLKKVKEKTTWMFTPTPNDLRLAQIALITQLKNELKPRSEAEVKKAVCILMGALFYRLLRLEYSYSSIFDFFRTTPIENFFKISVIDSCALHSTLRESLIKEGNVFDPQTIAVCCSAYKEYLRQAQVSDRYVYIKEDADFFSNLDLIIAKAKLAAKPVQAQLHYIGFIQSVAKPLKEYEEKVKSNLKALDHLLKSKLATEESIKRDEIIQCLQTLGLDSGTSHYIKELLPDNLVIDEESSLDFVEMMIERLKVYNQHILLGAYILPLKACHGVVTYPHLESAIRHIIEGLDNNLDTKSHDLAFRTLDFFVNLPGDSTMKFDSWGGAAFMKADLLKQWEELKKGQTIELAVLVM